MGTGVHSDAAEGCYPTGHFHRQAVKSCAPTSGKGAARSSPALPAAAHADAPGRPGEPGQALQGPWNSEEQRQNAQAPLRERRGLGVQGEPQLPQRAGLPSQMDYPPLLANTCHSAVVFQGFAFLKDLENIPEQLNIALVEAVPFTCLCSFNKHSLRACSVPDAGGQKCRPQHSEEGTPCREGPGQGRKPGLGRAELNTGNRCQAGRGPGAVGTHKQAS